MKKIIISLLIVVLLILSIAIHSLENKPRTLSEARISILGDSISTLDGVSNNAEMNETIRFNNAFYTENIMTQEQTYWGLLIEKYGMELCVNNSTGGGKVSDDVGTDGVRLSGIKRSTELHHNSKQMPDIIVVYMGTNDFLSAVPSTIFEETYTQMIDSLLKTYTTAEIFCFTLIPAKDSMYQNQMNMYNEKIRSSVRRFESRVTLVDIYEESGITWNNFNEYTLDALHPNIEGMKMIADAFEKHLLTLYK